MEKNFEQLFKPKTAADFEKMMRDEPKKSKMYYVADKEVKAALKSFGGFPNTDFKRVGNNVIIADGDIVVVIKTNPERVLTLYIVGKDVNDDLLWHLDGKKWATDEVIADILKAQELIIKN